MAFRFSANAKEFVPTGARNANQLPFWSFAGPPGSRPTQHNETYRPALPINEGQNVGEWNIAAPEFKPLESVQVRNPGCSGKDRRQMSGSDKDNIPESLNPSFRPKSGNRKHTGSSNQREKNQPMRQEGKGKKDSYRPVPDKYDDESQKSSVGYNRGSQKMQKAMKEKQRIPSEMGVGTEKKGHRKEKLSKQKALPQTDVRHSKGDTSDKGSEVLSKDSCKDSEGRFDPDPAIYPRLLGSRPLSSGQSMPSGRSWSKVLQSKPAMDNMTSSGNSKAAIQKDNKHMKIDEGFVAGGQGQDIFGKDGRKRWQKNTSNQMTTGAENRRSEDKGWNYMDGHHSSIWKNKQRPSAGLNTSRRVYQPYHGDLEWRVDAENARRQMAANLGSRVRNYSDMRAVRNVDYMRRQSTMITENYRFKNVTKGFSDRVKRIILSGCMKNERMEDAESYLKTTEDSRGWYESRVWNSRAEFDDGTKENRNQIFRDQSPKVPSFDSHEKQCNFTQKSLRQQNINKYGSVIDKKARDVAWSTISDASQVKQADLAQGISSSFQERSDAVTNRPAISRSAAETLEPNVAHMNKEIGENSRKPPVNALNDQPKLRDIQKEDPDFVDHENDWVRVTAKSTLKSRRKERLIASHQKFESGGQGLLDKSDVRSSSDGNPMSGNAGIVNKDIKVKQSCSNDIRAVDGKGKQGESTIGKKEKAKKRKKKKSKEKEKPLYDNDQQKIREFKMREMIEENLKMDLVELTKTRQSNDSKVEKEGAEEWPAIGSKGTHSAKLMSFSDALKSWKPAPERPTRIKTQQTHGDIDIDLSQLTEEEKIELRRKKLKEKRKQKKIEKKQRKRAEKGEEKEPDNQKMPLSFDLGIVFDRLLQSSIEEKSARKDSKKAAKTVLFSSGVISVASGVAKKNKPDGSRASLAKGKLSGNSLDSTQPLKMSGKERETPRKPKKTLLKKIILRAREAKQKAREAQLGKLPAEKERIEPSNEIENVNVDESEAKGKTDRIDSSHEASRVDVSVLAMKDIEDYPNKDEHSVRGGSDDHLCEPLTSLPKEVVAKLHSRKFREYCDHLLSDEINSVVYKILKSLHKFQTRAFLENPIKAKAKRRLVLGIREVAKHAKMGRLRCVIIAPNLEKVNIQGGIDFYLNQIIFNCKQFNVPTVYAMNRQVLGYILSRKVPVSAIGLFSYSGVEDDFQHLCMLVKEQREKYNERVKQIMLDLSQSHKVTVRSHEGLESVKENEIKSTVFRINPEAPLFIPQSMANNYVL